MAKTMSVKVERTGSIKIDDLDVSGIASALADNLRAAISSQPGDRWDRTGKLRNGIRADGDSVVAPPDRLSSPEVLDRFASDVMPERPLDKANVTKATRAAVAKSVGDK